MFNKSSLLLQTEENEWVQGAWRVITRETKQGGAARSNQPLPAGHLSAARAPAEAEGKVQAHLLLRRF